MKVFPLARPYITEQDVNAVVKVLNSGILALGPRATEFEKRFARLVGVKYACAVSSGTAGLHLTMLAAGIGPGDEVITTPFSFVASANCILYVGAKPVFVDIDPHTYNIDPQKIEAKITTKTKAIIAVHIFGQSAEMTPIMAIAKRYKLEVIEDACESIGAKYKDRAVGTFGQSAVFAFYPNKQMTTGEGGMIVTDSSRIYELCASLKNQGRSANMQWLNHQYLGYNYRLDEMSASLGLTQLRKLDFLIAERRRIAKLYSGYLRPYQESVYLPEVHQDNTHTWFVYVVQIKSSKISRDQVMELLKERGIATKPYLPSIHLSDFYRNKFGYKKGSLPVSERVSDHSLALPLYIGLKEKDIKYITNRLVEILTKYD